MQSRLKFWCLAGTMLALAAGCGSSSPKTGGGDSGPAPGDGSADTGNVSGDTGTGGDTGEGSDTGTGADTGTGSDTGTGEDTGTGSDTGTGGDTGVASDTGTGGDTSPALYTVGGTLSGLNGTVVLQDNSADNLTLTANGSFTFATALSTGSPFDVTVLTQPTGQLCAVMGPTGTINGANVTTVTIICATIGTDGGTDTGAGNPDTGIMGFGVGGTITGLPAGASVTLADNGADVTVSSNGTYAFPASVPSGTAYAVTVATQPVGATCTVANGSGTVTANVTNIAVTCVPATVTIGGTVTGLTGTVVLQDNGGNSLSVAANGAFTFTTAIASGATYAVTVLTQPVGQTCAVTGGTGTANATSRTWPSLAASRPTRSAARSPASPRWAPSS